MQMKEAAAFKIVPEPTFHFAFALKKKDAIFYKTAGQLLPWKYRASNQHLFLD